VSLGGPVSPSPFQSVRAAFLVLGAGLSAACVLAQVVMLRRHNGN